MYSLRLKKTKDSYLKRRKSKKDADCPICSRIPLAKFKYWKIIKNNFPYDRIAKKHDMIVPLRHIVEKDLKREEYLELIKIKNNFLKKEAYNYIMEATAHTKTLPEHFHLHLIVLK